MPEKKKPAPRTDYVVKVDSHKHKGKPVIKNDKISLTDAQAENLKNLGVI